MIERGQDGLVGDVVADAHRDVTHHAGCRRVHRVVAKLNFLLADRGFQSLRVRFRRVVRRLRKIQISFGDNAGPKQLFLTLQVYPVLLNQSLFGFQRCFLIVDCGFLLPGIDLQDGRARFHALAGLHIDLHDVALDLRLQDCGVTRFEGGKVVGGLRHQQFLSLRHLHRKSRGPSRLGAGITAADAEQRNCNENDSDECRLCHSLVGIHNNQFWIGASGRETF